MKYGNIEVSLVDHCGDDLSVVNAARVSFHKQSIYFVDRDAKLINYLAKHKHFSPFNHSFITMRVKAPIFVARQLVKHKFMPWNEVSRRYVNEEPEFYFPESWRRKADNVKQGSSDIVVDLSQLDNPIDPEVIVGDCGYIYNEMIDAGVCPEQARMILPQNTMTEWIWSGTLGAWCDMLRLRLDNHSQYETRVVAQKAHKIIKQLFPVSSEALLNAS